MPAGEIATQNSGKNRGSSNLKPFRKGQSGNPSGRPKTPESVKAAFSDLMPVALNALRSVLDGTDEDARTADRIKAAEIVFDRNLGKPVPSIDADMQDGGATVDTSKLTEEQREAIIALGNLMGTDDERGSTG